MDPIANLKEQRELARAILAISDLEEIDKIDLVKLAAKAARLAELVQALDEWQRMGGFSPYQTRQDK